MNARTRKGLSLLLSLVVWMAGLFLITPVQAADLLISNHSFENDLTGWTQTFGAGNANGTLSAVTERADDGTKSFKLTDNDPSGAFGLESAKLTATAGTTYVAYSRVYVASGNADLYIRFYNSSNAYISGAFTSISTPSGEWTNIQVKMTAPANTAKVAVLLYSNKESVGTAYWDNVLISKEFTGLGVQVYDAAPNGTTFGIGPNAHKAYGVVTGSGTHLPKMEVIDTNTESVTSVVAFPSGTTNPTGVWAAATSTDESIYFGAYSNGRLYKHTAGTTTITDLGQASTGETIIYDLKSGTNGKIYGGTFDSAAFFKYTPTAGFAQIGSKPFAAGKNYIRALAYDATHDVTYLGVGANAAVLRFDNVTGETTDILPSAYSGISLPGSIDYTGDRVFVGIGGTMVVLKVTENPDGSFQSVTTDAAVGATSHASPEHNGKAYFTNAGKLYAYDIAAKTASNLGFDVGGRVKRFEWVTLTDQTGFPGKTLVGICAINNQTYILKYNPQNGMFRLAQVGGAAKIPGDLNMISTGPEGNIYTSAYLTGGVGIYKPIRGDGNDALEEVMHSPITQVDKMGAYNGNMYFAAYPGGNLYEYDPSQPWAGGVNPRLLVSTAAQGQDRPKALAFGDGKVFMGTAAKTGAMDGALTVYNLTTGASTVHTGIVNDQSVVALAYYNGKVYGGTTVRGGYSTTPTTTAAEFFIYDPATGTVTKPPMPVAGIKAVTELIVVDNKIWGFADGYLLVFNPANNTFEYFQQKYTDVSYPNGTYRDADLVTVAKDPNYVYGTIKNTYLFKINKSTKAVTNIVTTGADMLTGDFFGNLYYKKNDSELWRYAH